MKVKNILSNIILIYLVVYSHYVSASGDLTQQKPEVMIVLLGDENNRLKFYPPKLIFETGKLYKLVIKNPSPQKHYFNNEPFSRSVFTRKAQIKNSEGVSLAEIKGYISEIEVYPNSTVEWWFVPVKTLNASVLTCSIRGHQAAGMMGEIIIK